jgi:hypothetical protein
MTETIFINAFSFDPLVCCALATSGHADAAAPPRSVMKSRRLID